MLYFGLDVLNLNQMASQVDMSKDHLGMWNLKHGKMLNLKYKFKGLANGGHN